MTSTCCGQGWTGSTELTGVPVLGVLPWLDGVWLDGEDTLQVGRWGVEHGGPDVAEPGDGRAVAGGGRPVPPAVQRHRRRRAGLRARACRSP